MPSSAVLNELQTLLSVLLRPVKSPRRAVHRESRYSCCDRAYFIFLQYVRLEFVASAIERRDPRNRSTHLLI